MEHVWENHKITCLDDTPLEALPPCGHTPVWSKVLVLMMTFAACASGALCATI